MDDVERSIRIGVSSCLLGCRVRFDGGHKKDDFLVNTFGAWVQWVPVCPEVEVGMGTPRESIRLVCRRWRGAHARAQERHRLDRGDEQVRRRDGSRNSRRRTFAATS